MGYAAKKIPLTCDEAVVRAWAAYLLGHMEQVVRSLRREGVRHEAWYMGRDDGGLYLIGVMDADDHAGASAAAQRSPLPVDAVHRRFKAHWDRGRITALAVAPDAAPAFHGCELLLDARA